MKATLGDEHFESNRRYDRLDKGLFVIHLVPENETMMQCVILGVEGESPTDQAHKLTRLS